MEAILILAYLLSRLATLYSLLTKFHVILVSFIIIKPLKESHTLLGSSLAETDGSTPCGFNLQDLLVLHFTLLEGRL